MIFDSKRREARELEAEAAVLEESAYAARSVAPDDARSRPVGEPVADEVKVADPRGLDPANERVAERNPAGTEGDELEPLFPTDVAKGFRTDWDAVQIGFVDDPRQAVRRADALVNDVLGSLSETFTGERSRLEAQVAQAGSISTEDLRVALRRYRSLLHRLLAL